MHLRKVAGIAATIVALAALNFAFEYGVGDFQINPYYARIINLVGINSGGSSDSRSIAFSPSGDRLYVVNRRPPSLQIFDTSLSASGVPKNLGIGVLFPLVADDHSHRTT